MSKGLFDEPEQKTKAKYADAIKDLTFFDLKLSASTKWTLVEAKKDIGYDNETVYKYTFDLCQNSLDNPQQVETHLYLTTKAPIEFEWVNNKKKEQAVLDKSFVFHIFEVHGFSDMFETEFVLPWRTKAGKSYKKGDKVRRFMMSKRFVGVKHVESESKPEWTPDSSLDLKTVNDDIKLLGLITNMSNEKGVHIDSLRKIVVKKFGSDFDLNNFLVKLLDEGLVYNPDTDYWKET